MVKYLFKRLLHGLVSIVIVVAIVMVLIYSLLSRQLVFQQDDTYHKLNNNQKNSRTTLKLCIVCVSGRSTDIWTM